MTLAKNKIDTLSDEEIKKLQQIIDVIFFKAKSENIKDSADLMGKYIQAITNEIIIPYNHFPDTIKPFEINQLILRLADDFKVIIRPLFKSDTVSVRFPVNGNDSFMDLKKIIDAEYYKKTKKEVESPKSSSENLDFFYNSETGLGKFKGKNFKLTDDIGYRKIFDACFEIRGRKLIKEKVVEILGLDKSSENIDVAKVFGALGDQDPRRKSIKDVSITAKVNEIAKDIRKKTGLNTEEFVNNGCNLTLNI